MSTANQTMSVQQAMDLAVAQHRAGQLAQAQDIYRRVLKQQPNNASALHLLGLVTYQAGNPTEGLDWITRAIAINPEIADYHLNEGVILDSLGRTREAIVSFKKAISINPNVAEAYVNMGNALRKTGALDEAITACRKALEIRPDYVEALVNMGNALQEQYDYDKAIAAFERVVQLRPEFAEAHHNLGNALAKAKRFQPAIEEQRKALRIKPNFAHAANALGAALRESAETSANTGDLEAAIDAFRLAVTYKPDLVQALVNLAQALREKAIREALAADSDQAPPIIEESVNLLRLALARAPGMFEAQLALGKSLVVKKDWDQAIVAYRNAVAIKPASLEGHLGLSDALARRGDWDAAMAAYTETLALNPDLAEGYYGMGMVLCHQRDFERAVAALRRAVSLRPASVEWLTFLGNTLCQKGDFTEGLGIFRKVLELDPHYALGHWNLALMLLTHGQFEEGWKEYEWRWQVRELDMQFRRAAPLWDGSDLEGKRILLVGEQGLGDAMQCARYIPMVAAKGGKIVLAVHKELHRLLHDSPLGKDVVDWVMPEQSFPQYDRYCPLLTLPRVFGTNADNIPAPIPYLAANEERKRNWQARLPADGRMKVGLAWAGKPKHVNDINRSIPAELLSPLRDVKGLWFCSLQKGPIARPDERPHLEMADWTNELIDFADTAALVDNLDLVICADTAVAHLAGAMGKKVWVLLPFLPDWRWLLNRTDSPWYPTMRLFRQEQPGDWKTPIAALTEALRSRNW